MSAAVTSLCRLIATLSPVSTPAGAGQASGELFIAIRKLALDFSSIHLQYLFLCHISAGPDHERPDSVRPGTIIRMEAGGTGAKQRYTNVYDHYASKMMRISLNVGVIWAVASICLSIILATVFLQV